MRCAHLLGAERRGRRGGKTKRRRRRSRAASGMSDEEEDQAPPPTHALAEVREFGSLGTNRDNNRNSHAGRSSLCESKNAILRRPGGSFARRDMEDGPQVPLAPPTECSDPRRHNVIMMSDTDGLLVSSSQPVGWPTFRRAPPRAESRWRRPAVRPCAPAADVMRPGRQRP